MLPGKAVMLHVRSQGTCCTVDGSADMNYGTCAFTHRHVRDRLALGLGMAICMLATVVHLDKG